MRTAPARSPAPRSTTASASLKKARVSPVSKVMGFFPGLRQLDDGTRLLGRGARNRKIKTTGQLLGNRRLYLFKTPPLPMAEGGASCAGLS
jgi:hypothetical protein